MMQGLSNCCIILWVIQSNIPMVDILKSVWNCLPRNKLKKRKKSMQRLNRNYRLSCRMNGLVIRHKNVPSRVVMRVRFRMLLVEVLRREGSMKIQMLIVAKKVKKTLRQMFKKRLLKRFICQYLCQILV